MRPPLRRRSASHLPSACRAWPLLLLLAACVRYVPRPVDPAAHPAEYRARRLDDARLLEWVGRWAARPEPGRWTDRQLALAALAFRADVARARADWRTALAGQAGAGVRPAPGVEAGVERAVSGSEGQSPWVVSLAGLVAVELGGKRGARLQRARARTAVAEGELRQSAWRVVWDVRAAALALASAAADRAQAERELKALVEVQGLEQARYREGSLPSAELARTGAEVQAARAQVVGAEAGVQLARAALAGAVAVPARALDTVEVSPVPGPGCDTLGALEEDSLGALALTRRPEIGRALAEYAVAEADLRLQVARQLPDLELGPGFIWDQGVHRWTLALALPNLLGFRNRAAIHEAEAARSAAAARVAEVQDELLADIAVALRRCQGALLQRAAADSQVAVSGEAAALARAAYDRGETSRLEPALAELAVARAERGRAAVEAQLRSAGEALSTSAGGWRGEPDEPWPDPRVDQLTEGATR